MKTNRDILAKFISTQGYKRNSPDKNRPFNIIPSGNITMQDVDFPVYGVDNLGNEQLMIPGAEYTFPGDYVVETPMAQTGGTRPPIFTSNPNDPRIQNYSDSLNLYNYSKKLSRLFPKLPEVTEQQYKQLQEKDNNLLNYEFDEVAYKKDKKEGTVKNFDDYIYSGKQSEIYSTPQYLKNNQKELDKYSNDDTGKYDIQLPNGTIKSPGYLYNGKPQWDMYSIWNPNTKTFSHYSKNIITGKDELSHVSSDNIKPVAAKYYGEDKIEKAGVISTSSKSTGWYKKGDKPVFKTDSKKEYVDTYIPFEKVDVYKKPVQPVIYKKQKLANNITPVETTTTVTPTITPEKPTPTPKVERKVVSVAPEEVKAGTKTTSGKQIGSGTAGGRIYRVKYDNGETEILNEFEYRSRGLKKQDGGQFDPVSTPGQELNFEELKKQQEERLKAEKLRVELVRGNVITLANKAIRDKEYQKQIFKTKLKEGSAYCSTRNCEVERAAGITVPKDVKVYGKNIKAGSKLPVIPGTSSFDTYAPSLGYEKIPINELEPGDRMIDFYPSGAHSMIFSGDEVSRNSFIYDNGSGTYFKESYYPIYDKDPKHRYQGYRYVGDVPNMQNKLNNVQRGVDTFSRKNNDWDRYNEESKAQLNKNTRVNKFPNGGQTGWLDEYQEGGQQQMYPGPSLQFQQQVKNFVNKTPNTFVRREPVTVSQSDNTRTNAVEDAKRTVESYSKEDIKYFLDNNIPKERWGIEKVKMQEQAVLRAREAARNQSREDVKNNPFAITKATNENLRNEFRAFPNDPNSFFDEYLNPAQMIGNLAANLGDNFTGEQPIDPWKVATDVVTPAFVGMTAGIGAQNTGQFANNLINPLAGKNSFFKDLEVALQNLNPKNLKTESGTTFMKNWYSNPDFSRRYNPTGQYRSSDMQPYTLNMLEQYQPKNYIDLYKDKGAKTYLEKGITTGGTSWGIPEEIYVNRPMYAPFNRKGLESTRVHELTHLIENNGFQLSELDEKALLKPFGISNKNQISKDSGIFGSLSDARYYLDPTEIHARMNQARFDLGLSPQQKFTEEMADKISKKNDWYGMGKYIKDKKALVDLMNNFWAVPVAVGAGAALNTKKTGGQTNWLDEYE